jgi:hypothetical protein
MMRTGKPLLLALGLCALNALTHAALAQAVPADAPARDAPEVEADAPLRPFVPPPAEQVSAEPAFRRGTWMLSAEVGGAAFTDFQRARAQPMAGDDLPGFRRRVSAGTTATVGASVSYWLLDGWGLRGSLSYSPTRFSVWNEAHAQHVFDQFGTEDETTYARLGSWTASTTAVFRFPFSIGRVVPYGMVGAGVVHYRLADREEVPAEARQKFSDGQWSGAAAVFGIGSAIPLQRYGLLMTFELTNHLARTPLDDEGVGEWFEFGGTHMQIEHDPARGNDGVVTTNNLRLTLGLTLPLGPGRHDR